MGQVGLEAWAWLFEGEELPVGDVGDHVAKEGV
jgi:hypothetical protein